MPKNGEISAVVMTEDKDPWSGLRYRPLDSVVLRTDVRELLLKHLPGYVTIEQLLDVQEAVCSAVIDWREAARKQFIKGE